MGTLTALLSSSDVMTPQRISRYRASEKARRTSLFENGPTAPSTVIQGPLLPSEWRGREYSWTGGWEWLQSLWLPGLRYPIQHDRQRPGDVKRHISGSNDRRPEPLAADRRVAGPQRRCLAGSRRRRPNDARSDLNQAITCAGLSGLRGGPLLRGWPVGSGCSATSRARRRAPDGDPGSSQRGPAYAGHAMASSATPEVMWHCGG